ncbi:MAG: Uma2 family endonuclease, partial [Pseudomonadota bacterium]
ARRHAGAASVLGALLGNPFQLGIGGPGGWTFVDEPELHLDDHVLVPDISGWRNENVSEPPDQAHFKVAPDWACEVISPGTESRDRGVKREIHASNGVSYLWFVDPRPRLIEVYELRGGVYALLETFTGSAKVSAPPFTELTFDLDLLWPFDKPETA